MKAFQNNILLLLLLALASRVAAQPCQSFRGCLPNQCVAFSTYVQSCRACVVQANVPDVASQTCRPCSQIIPNCLTCAVEQTQGVPTCSQCESGFLRGLGSRNCVSTCPGISLDSNQDRVCDCLGGTNNLVLSTFDNCVSNCPNGQINYQNQCYTSCPIGTYLYVNTLTLARSCVAVCPDLFVRNLLQTACIPQANCTGGATPTNKICQCNGGTPVINSLGNDCIAESCTENAANGFIEYRQDGILKCVSTCLSGQVFIARTGGSYCLPFCPSGLVVDLETNSCVGTCSGGNVNAAMDRCVCPDMTPVFDPVAGTCVVITNCTSNSFLNAEGTLCVTDCPQGQYQSADPPRCVRNCPTGQFVDINGQVCVAECTSPTFDSDSDGFCDCLSNRPNRFISSDKMTCISNCNVERSLLQSDGIRCGPVCLEGEVADINLICNDRCTRNSTDADGDGVCECSGQYPISGILQQTPLDVANKFCVAQCAAPQPLRLEIASNVVSCVDQTTCNLLGISVTVNGTNCATCSAVNQITGLLGLRCTTQCPFNSANVSSACVCNSGAPFIVSETQGCTANCALIGLLNPPTGSTPNSCVSKCPPNYVISQSGAVRSCVIECPLNSVKDLLLKTCIADCPTGTQMVVADQCQCINPSLVIAANGTGCIAACSAGQYRSVARPTCFAAADGCPAGQLIPTSGFNCVLTCQANQTVNLERTACRATCPAGQLIRTQLGVRGCYAITECPSDEILFAAGNQCGSSCPTGQFENFINDRCVSNCGPGFIDISSTRCLRACALTQFISLDRTRCVADCGSNKINLNGDACVTTCPGNSIDSPIIDGICDCASGTANLINSNGDGCIAACPAGQVESLAGGKCLQQCEEQEFINLNGTQCISICPGTSIDSDEDGQCDCDITMPMIPINLYITPDFQDCQARCQIDEVLVRNYPNPNGASLLVCLDQCPSFQPFTSLTNNECLTRCEPGAVETPAGSFICKCPTSLPLLNAASSACLASCPGMELINLAGDQCVPSCQLNQLISSDNKTCVDACEPTQFISLGGSRCLVACPAGQQIFGTSCVCQATFTLQSEDGQTCYQTCPLGTFPNAAMSTCVASCVDAVELYSIDGLSCVSSCSLQTALGSCVSFCPPPTVQNTAVCVCAAGQFVSIDGFRCLTSCQLNQIGDTTAIPRCVCDIAGGAVRSITGNQCLTGCPPPQVNRNGQCDLSCATAQEVIDLSGTCAMACEENAVINQQRRCICASGFVRNFAGDACQRSCNSFEIVVNGRCVCVAGAVLSQDGSGCEMPCPQSQALNVQGTQCLSNCPLNQQEIDGRCQCAAGDLFSSAGCLPFCYPYGFLSVSKKQCTNICGVNQVVDINPFDLVQGYRCICNKDSVLNLAGSQCLPECPPTQVIGANRQCICDTGFILNVAGNRCVALDCGENEVRNIQGNCVCAVGAAYLRSQMICVLSCRSYGLYLNQASTECVSGCDPLLINLADTQCVQRCGPAQISSMGRCVCDLSVSASNVPNADRSACLFGGCGSQALNLNGTQCITACPDGQTEINDRCECTSGLANVNRSGCVAQCGANQYISLDGRRCLLECPQNQLINLQGTACVSACAAPEVNGTNGRCVCPVGNVILNGRCATLNECMTTNGQFISANNVCQNCQGVNRPCLTCSRVATNCSSCNSGDVLNSSSTRANEKDCIISNCRVIGCQTCIEGYSSYCAVCAPGYTLNNSTADIRTYKKCFLP